MMLALVYHSVAARLGLHLGCVCAGGQRLLRSGGDEDGSSRSPSGRRCSARNLWPLRRIHSPGTEGVLLQLVLSPLKEEEEEGEEVPGGGAVFTLMCVTEEDFSMPPARSSGVWPRLRYASVAGQQWCVRLLLL